MNAAPAHLNPLWATTEREPRRSASRLNASKRVARNSEIRGCKCAAAVRLCDWRVSHRTGIPVCWGRLIVSHAPGVFGFPLSWQHLPPSPSLPSGFYRHRLLARSVTQVKTAERLERQLGKSHSNGRLPLHRWHNRYLRVRFMIKIRTQSKCCSVSVASKWKGSEWCQIISTFPRINPAILSAINHGFELDSQISITLQSSQASVASVVCVWVTILSLTNLSGEDNVFPGLFVKFVAIRQQGVGIVGRITVGL